MQKILINNYLNTLRKIKLCEAIGHCLKIIIASENKRILLFDRL